MIGPERANEQGHADDAAIFARLAEANARVRPPDGLVDRIERRLRRDRHRRLQHALAGLAAAAVLVLAVLGWMLVPRAPRTQETPRTVVAVDRPAAPSVATRVSFDPRSPLFGRSIESEDPRVTIVMVYRSVRPVAAETPAKDTPTTQGSES